MKTRRSSALLPVLVAACLAIAYPVSAQEPRRVTLDEAVQLFARNSLELRIARSAARASAGEARQRAAYPNPTVTGTHEPLSEGDVTYSESYLNLSQRLVWPGTRSATSRAARHAVEAGYLAYAADSARLAFDVKRAYADAVRARRVAEVLRRVTEVFRAGDESAERRYGEGDISLYDRRRIHVERIRYEARLAESELASEAGRRAFATLVAPEEPDALAPADLPEGLPPEAAADPATVALGRRPDLAAVEAEAASALARASAARRDRIPDLVATGGYKTQSDGLTGVFLGLSFELPLWDRGGAAVQAAEADASGAEARLALTRRRVETDVRDADDAYRSALRRARMFGETPGEPAEPDLLQIAEAAYREGEMELIELLDAAEAMLEAEMARIQLRADLWISYYDLERAIGGFEAPMNDGREE